MTSRTLACAALIAGVPVAAMYGCGSASKTASAVPGVVSVAVDSPTSGSVIAADTVTIRGTVSPPSAVVQIQGKAAAVGNGVFTGTASLHNGKTTIDVIGSAPGVTPGSTKVTIVRQASKPSTQTDVTKTVVVPQTEQAQPSRDSATRTFFAPSGNVTCMIQGAGAKCSVASANLTFVLPTSGGMAYSMGGLAVPRGIGSEASFGTAQSNGQVLCTIPPSNTPAGITCRNDSTGHGFEASRVPSRQQLY